MSDEDLHNKLDAYEEERLAIKPRHQQIVPWLIITPVFTFLLSLALFKQPGISVIVAALSLALVGLFHYFSVTGPFTDLKHKVRDELIREFMNTYHPDVSYRYHARKQKVRSIVKDSKLISANVFKEEDVIEGRMNGASFYLSEIHLRRSSGKSTYKVFEGILMKIYIPGKQFPTTQIQSKPDYLKRIFSGFIEEPDYGFWYESRDPDRFKDELEPLFPFIQHLMKKHRGLRIKAEGEALTIMLDTDMEFLDEPKPHVTHSFHDQDYYNNLGRKLNSLLFIVESFVNNLSASDIEERLELKMLEYEKIIRKK